MRRDLKSPGLRNLAFIGDVVPGSLPVLIHFVLQGFKVSAILIGHLLIFADHETKEKSGLRWKRSLALWRHVQANAAFDFATLAQDERFSPRSC